MKIFTAFLLAVVSTASAQLTSQCPDGWVLHELENRPNECYLFGNGGRFGEKLTHEHAQDLCQDYGGWLLELEDGPRDNYFVVSKLIEIWDINNKNSDNTRRPHFEDQWWIGGKSVGPHSDSNPGIWTWEHSNTTISWFDWADGEPNNFNRQQCLTFVRFTDIFGRTDFHWNDWDCGEVADFICERDANEAWEL